MKAKLKKKKKQTQRKNGCSLSSEGVVSLSPLPNTQTSIPEVKSRGGGGTRVQQQQQQQMRLFLQFSFFVFEKNMTEEAFDSRSVGTALRLVVWGSKRRPRTRKNPRSRDSFARVCIATHCRLVVSPVLCSVPSFHRRKNCPYLSIFLIACRGASLSEPLSTCGVPTRQTPPPLSHPSPPPPVPPSSSPQFLGLPRGVPPRDELPLLSSS